MYYNILETDEAIKDLHKISIQGYEYTRDKNTGGKQGCCYFKGALPKAKLGEILRIDRSYHLLGEAI